MCKTSHRDNTFVPVCYLGYNAVSVVMNTIDIADGVVDNDLN